MLYQILLAADFMYAERAFVCNNYLCIFVYKCCKSFTETDERELQRLKKLVILDIFRKTNCLKLSFSMILLKIAEKFDQKE